MEAVDPHDASLIRDRTPNWRILESREGAPRRGIVVTYTNGLNEYPPGEDPGTSLTPG